MMNLLKLPGALPDEKLINVYRRHPITLLGLMVTTLVVMVLPIGAYSYLRIMQPEFLQNQTAMTLVVLVACVFFLFLALFVYQQFLDYWLDMWILTNRRVINIEQNGLFNRVVSELRLYRVQDVTSEVKGFVRSMMDFGQCYVQTAGEKDYFIFEDVPNPTKISKQVLELAEIDRKEHLEEAMEAMEQTEVDHHDAIRQKTAQHLEP